MGYVPGSVCPAGMVDTQQQEQQYNGSLHNMSKLAFLFLLFSSSQPAYSTITNASCLAWLLCLLCL